MQQSALDYHEFPRPGKTGLAITKSVESVEDLSLAYSPGVAEPCRVIAKDPEAVYRFTNKANLVAVITNGTAVLGLGNIGPLAAKPVMEGKAVLFKRFAGIDAIDLEIDEKDPERFVGVVRSLAGSIGGINLEDIKAPECFPIERALKEALPIPVFHDDQHGTAVVASAALRNALTITRRDFATTKAVLVGAGAAGVAIATMLKELGLVQLKLFDSKGILHSGRELEEHRSPFASDKEESLEDALKGADVFIGVSARDLLTREMVARMAERPIVLALANPDPEIAYEEAKKVPGAIIATGRSDYPNQVNNVLCFPFLFRAALDVRAGTITRGMLHAASEALARLAREPVPEEVARLYGEKLAFGPEYLLPKPMDPRLLPEIASAIAQKAMEEGVARKRVDAAQYRKGLERRSALLAQGEFE